ncbi:hypothetical protein M0R45_025550 [Rubus argutus]|uniref:Uncharacterized protein n=1 Tax=Rubus argutus TaxID=59490 RepID=A0AAW1WWL1_RUBAR
MMAGQGEHGLAWLGAAAIDGSVIGLIEVERLMVVLWVGTTEERAEAAMVWFELKEKEFAVCGGAGIRHGFDCDELGRGGRWAVW